MKRRKDEFCLSSRRRLQDSVPLGNNEYMSAHKLLETDPVRLWNLVHTSGSKVSLTRPTHFKLKQVISDVAPELIVENDGTKYIYMANNYIARYSNNYIASYSNNYIAIII